MAGQGSVTYEKTIGGAYTLDLDAFTPRRTTATNYATLASLSGLLSTSTLSLRFVASVGVGAGVRVGGSIAPLKVMRFFGDGDGDGEIRMGNDAWTIDYLSAGTNERLAEDDSAPYVALVGELIGGEINPHQFVPWDSTQRSVEALAEAHRLVNRPESCNFEYPAGQELSEILLRDGLTARGARVP